jgi:hypothetical protein
MRICETLNLRMIIEALLEPEPDEKSIEEQQRDAWAVGTQVTSLGSNRD